METSIEDLLNNGSDYLRVDLLIALRALKVIEQLVFSRSSGVSGPLTVAVFVSGVCEVTLSFSSVLNSMGILLSYNMTEKYRQRLIADRESQGPWDWEALDKEEIPVLQFYNWDIKPLHAVKVDRKAMPKGNSSLLQGQTRKRRADSDAQSVLPHKKVRCTANDTWMPVVVLENREKFIDKFDSVAHERLISQFNDVVFGLAYFYRQALLGGWSLDPNDYNVGIRSDLQHDVREKPINFRTLLLSAFKPHGGK